MAFGAERFQRTGIQEGKDLERGILGKPNNELSVEKYKPYQQSLKEVLESNPSQLSDSLQSLKSAVHNKINPHSGFVKVRSALGTPLDIYHGIDLVMEYDGNVATIDITSNGEKIASGAKADVILAAYLDDEGIPTIEEHVLEQASSEIARKLLLFDEFKQAA